MFRFVLVKGIVVVQPCFDWIRGSLVLLRFIATGHHLPHVGNHVKLLRIHVDAGELDAAIRHLRVVRQVLDDVLDAPGRVWVSVLRQLWVPRPFERRRLRRLEFPVKRRRSYHLRFFVLVRIGMFVPAKLMKNLPCQCGRCAEITRRVM